MIRRYKIGQPIPTEAPVRELVIESGQSERIQLTGWGRKSRAEAAKGAEDTIDNPLEITEQGLDYQLRPQDIVYGLGQNVRGLNKRGYVYVSKCSDDFTHSEDKSSLYGAHNFLIVAGEIYFGLFVDTPRIVTFDVGFSNTDRLQIRFEDLDYDLYVITGDSAADIVKQFRGLVGKSYFPPKWAFGYGQSRWSYMNRQEVEEVVRRHRENNIPLDSVYLDIDYMEEFKDFTINQQAFPDFAEFVAEMKKEHIHLVPIIDAGVKIQPGYPVYEEGVAQNYFCKKEDGKDIVCGVWPGDVHFPDFLNPETRRWFGEKYNFLMKQGIDGFWNDMNEPSIFYTRDHLEEVFDQLEQYKDKNLDLHHFFEMQGLVANLSNNPEDYKRFYHNYKGKKYRHDKVHNLYGFNMTRAAGEAFERLTDQPILMFSRSSYIGAHRYGGIWQGDNYSWWSHIKLNMVMTMSLNMAGFLYTGADIGGFNGDTSPDLLLRWLEFGIFTPLMRNHSAIYTRRQEVYQFDNLEDYRNIIELRYGLLPYIYREFGKAVEQDGMYMKPLAFDYPQDEMARRVEDQILVGDSIMIAPIYEQNAVGRYVYLPEPMKMLRIKSLRQIEEVDYLKGHHYIEIALNQVVIFIRPGKSLPLSNGGNYVDQIDEKNLIYYQG